MFDDKVEMEAASELKRVTDIEYKLRDYLRYGLPDEFTTVHRPIRMQERITELLAWAMLEGVDLSADRVEQHTEPLKAVITDAVRGYYLRKVMGMTDADLAEQEEWNERKAQQLLEMRNVQH